MEPRRAARLRANQLEMLCLRELPHSPDALPRYVACVCAFCEGAAVGVPQSSKTPPPHTHLRPHAPFCSLKQRRHARSIQLWYRKHAPRRRSGGAPSRSAFSNLPSDVTGLRGLDDTLGEALSMDASVRLDLGGGGARGVGGGVGSGALAAAPSAAAAAAYAAAVSEAALEEAEARVLARAAARPRGELDALRDRVDAALGARARRAVGSGGAEAAHGARAAALAAVAAAVKRLAAPPAPGNALRAARAPSPSPPLPAPPPPKEAERRDGALPPWPPGLTPEARRAAVAAHEAARAASSGARPWWLVAREGGAFDARDAHPPWPAAGGEGGARNFGPGAAGARALPAGGGAAALLAPRAAPRTPVAVAPVVDALAIHGCGGGGGATAAGRAALAAPPPRGQPLFEPRAAPAACSDAAASDAWIALCCAPLPSYGAGVGGWRGGAAPRSGSGAALDGTLAAAVAALGVVDPWETSAAVMDPTAVSAAVRAAAAASAAVEEEAAAGGGGEALEALLRGGGEGGDGAGAPPPPVTPLAELLDLNSEIAHLPPFDLRAAAATPVLASGSRATIATPALAPAAESIAARVVGAYEAARRQVALADALECLEEEGGGGGGGGGAARGRPPPATLAALTRAVRARAIQRFWRGLVATREARAELDARRSAARGKEGALRAAVAALLDALGGGESAGGGAQPAGAATSLLRSLQASAAKPPPPPPPPPSGRPPLQRHVAGVAQAKAQPAGGGFLRYPQRGVGVGGAAAAAAVAARPTLRIEGGAVEGATSAGSSPGLLLLQPITISGAELPSATSSFLRASSDSLAGV